MSDEQEERVIKIEYLKTNHFRSVYVDGVFGGITPRGLIHMDIWSERPPIPRHIEHRLEDGAIGEELRENRQSIDADSIREIEVGLSMSLPMAKAMVEWLQDKIRVLEELHEKAQVGQHI